MRPARRSRWRGRSRAPGRGLGSSSCAPIYPALRYHAAPIRGVPLPDIDTIRRAFTSLSRTGADGRPLVFLDGPGGSQVPDVVIDAMADYLRHSNANIDGAFVTSAETTELVDSTRVAAADFLGCEARGDRLRGQHDDDQLQPRARLLPHARAGRRDRRHRPRPRRERQPVAAVRPGSRPRRAHGRRSRRRPAGRARCARGDRRPAHEGVRVHARLERDRDDARRRARSPTSRTPSARSPGWTACTTRRTVAST